MSDWPPPGLPPRVGGSPDDRRPPYGRGYYDPYGRDPYDRPAYDWDRERAWDDWDRRRRGRSPSPGPADGRRKRRGSFSPSSERERYEPRPRYDDDHRPARNSRFPDPYEAEHPVNMRAFVDWFKATNPDEYKAEEKAVAEGDKTDDAGGGGLKARYEKYRKEIISKQMQLMFDHHKKSPWFQEQYSPAPEYHNLRLRVRREGWESLLDKFLSELAEGQHDPKVFDPSSGSSEESNGQVLQEKTAPDANENGGEEEDRDEDEDVHDAEPDAEAEKTTGEQSGKPDEKLADATVEPENSKTADAKDIVEDQEMANGEPTSPTASKGRKPDLENRIQPRPSPKDEEVTIEPVSNQVLIRTLPPDIARLKLEKVCREISGFDHLALGDTMQKRNYYRAGWITFKEGTDMTEVINRLSDAKIEGFKLHVSQSTRPWNSRARYAPETSLRPERIVKDLANARKLAGIFEEEAHRLRALPEKLPEPRNLPKSKGGELDDSPTTQDGEKGADEQPAEDDGMAVAEDSGPKDRGSKAVDERIETVWEQWKAHREDGSTEILAETELEHRKNILALDFYCAYLRHTFNCCYYCSAAFDFPEELQRKCIKHNRRTGSSTTDSRTVREEERWEDHLDSKTALLIDRDSVDPRDYGGKLESDELSRMAKPHVKQDEEGRYRCLECSKLFKAINFIEKHLLTKHEELMTDAKNVLADIPFFNNWALDPQKIQPFTHVPPPNANGQQAPPEAFGLKTGTQRAPSRSSNYPGYQAPYAYPPAAYYPPPPYADPYYRDYYAYAAAMPPPPPHIAAAYGYGMPPPPMFGVPPPGMRGGGGGPGGGRRSPRGRGGHLESRIGGYPPDGPPGSGRRGGGGPDPGAGGAPPPGAREDPRAAGGRKVSYHDIDRTAEGDVQLSY